MRTKCKALYGCHDGREHVFPCSSLEHVSTSLTYLTGIYYVLGLLQGGAIVAVKDRYWPLLPQGTGGI